MTSETAYLNGGNHHHHHHHHHHHQQQQQPQSHQYPNLNQSSSSTHSPSSSSSSPSPSSNTTSSLNNSSNDPQQQQQQQQLSQQDLLPLYDPNIKYPLENSWSFWFYKGEKGKTWKDNVKFITTVDYVEDFWAVYNHLQLVSKINIGCDYMFFKKDVPPMWEDPANSDGGTWRLNLEKKYHNTCLDTYWLNILLALIGDQFYDEGPYVNGVWVSVRGKMDKIALWTKAAKNSEVQHKIGNRFRDILGIKDKEQILAYECHASDTTSSEPVSLYKI